MNPFAASDDGSLTRVLIDLIVLVVAFLRWYTSRGKDDGVD